MKNVFTIQNNNLRIIWIALEAYDTSIDLANQHGIISDLAVLESVHRYLLVSWQFNTFIFEN